VSAWYPGLRAHLELVTAPTAEPLALANVRDNHLRVTNGTAEDAYIEALIKVSRRRAERVTRRALPTQTWRLVLDRFPCERELLLPLPPLQEVVSVDYLDEDGERQTWGGSPLPYDVAIPSGPTAGRARIAPVYDTTWPDHRVQLGSVRVTFTCGYADAGSPALPDVPEDITHGMLLMIGELYKQRSESVHAFNQNPALVRARDLWLAYQVY
jgi:uncharacterized phiE125 gp8 family phage protein